MELFVVNRHTGEDEGGQENNREDDENRKLQKVLKRIEKNKKLRSKQKEREKKLKVAKQKTLESRQIKRELKSNIIHVPENQYNEFLDSNFVNGDKDFVDEKIKSEEDINFSKKHESVKDDLKGFTILGGANFTKKGKVKRVLPNWLLNPTIISVNLKKLYKKVSEVKELDKGIRKCLKANGIKYFFPVQAEVIPWLLQSVKNADVVFPRDICVSAPTGSGKTLAFVLPVIQGLKRYTVKKIRALVILPTQDLATQVYKTFKTYTQNTNIDVCLVAGQNPFSTEQTQLMYENKAFGRLSKVDIVVCTAGRLVDHLKLTKGFNLQDLEFLIIDEADRVLETIQNDWLYHLEKHINQDDAEMQKGRVLNLFALQGRRPPQKLLFSATLSQDPEKLQKLSLFQPKLFTSVEENSNEKSESDKLITETFIGKYTTPRELTEKYIVSSLDLKPLVLYKFIKSEKLTKSIVFTHSVESAHRLAILLQSLFKNDLKVEEISSNLQGKNRNQLIDKFSSGEIDLFVCTDRLARGIDLPCIQCVISYSAPKYLKTYIHRAGRTARAGEEGLAVTMLHKSQVTKFKNMLQQADKTNLQEVILTEEDLEPLGELYKNSLEDLKKVVAKEEKLDLKKNISAKRSKAFKRKRKDSIISNSNKEI